MWRLNAPGDYAVIDAAVVTVDASQAGAPFSVTGLLTGAAAPAVCDFWRR